MAAPRRLRTSSLTSRTNLTYTAMAGKSDAERNAATAMLIILDRGGKMSLDESKNLMFTGTDEEKEKAKCANGLLYTILALNTTWRAKEIGKETAMTRNGVEVWVKLRDKFSKTTGATSYAEIFKYIGRTTRRSRTNGESGVRRLRDYRQALCQMRQKKPWSSRVRARRTRRR